MKKFLDGLWDFRGIYAVEYAVFIIFMLPLYMKNGFNMIGDAKYYFFYWVAIVGMAIWPVFLAAGLFGKKLFNEKGLCIPDLSYAELFAGFFLIVTLVSVVFSIDRDTAKWGIVDWHMGGIMQGMILFGFFLMKRWLTMDKPIFVSAWLAVFLICALVISNRCGDDPLGVYKGMDWFDWNRRNLLATIGNINWLCCYLAVAVPFLLYFAWISKGYWRIPGMAGAFVGVAAIFLQGSDAGIADLAVFLVILLLVSLTDMQSFLRFWEIAMMVPLFWSVFSVFNIDLITPADNYIKGRYNTLWVIPLIIMLLLEAGIRLYYSKTKKDIFSSGKIRKWVILFLIVAFIAAIGVLIGCQVSDDLWIALGARPMLKFGEKWGSLRGGLWKRTLELFGQFGILRKSFGVGPDCYGVAVAYLPEWISAEGQWTDAFYANAHNEFLTMLINEGIMGAITYLGIFIAVLVKCLKKWKENSFFVLGLMIVTGYLVNQFFAFQQVVSTPFVFIILGMLDRETAVYKIDKKR